jgi:hypothetical protein
VASASTTAFIVAAKPFCASPLARVAAAAAARCRSMYTHKLKTHWCNTGSFFNLEAARPATDDADDEDEVVAVVAARRRSPRCRR